MKYDPSENNLGIFFGGGELIQDTLFVVRRFFHRDIFLTILIGYDVFLIILIGISKIVDSAAPIPEKHQVNYYYYYYLYYY